MLLPRRRWLLRPPDPARSRALAERLGLSPIAAQVLLHRGVSDDAAAARFLGPSLRSLHDPFAFRDMARAAERLHAAVARGEPILLYGDYDVDGTTGTALLLRCLRLMGARARAFIPDRVRDGYGLRPERIAEAAAAGARVAVAIDNGTTAFEAAEAARRAGIDLIVADHHEPAIAPDGTPRVAPAFALLNPRAPGETYPFPSLCGCGVAFKLAWALAQMRSPGARVSPEMRAFLVDALSLVAVGTVADLVPLVGENRDLVAHGLRALGATENHGLRALLRAARAEGGGAPTAEDVAFRLAPRLNAAGRMGDARLVLELLAAEDRAAAAEIAARLDAENRRRQALERRILAEALPRAEDALAKAGGRALVLADAQWHLGVIGIVASRLLERFWRPVVLIALFGNRERGRGSARSVPGIALTDALARCREELIAFGGHEAAAGIEIRADRIDRFRERLGEAVAAVAAGAAAGLGTDAAGGATALLAPPADLAAAEPPLAIDAEAPLAACSRALVDDLGRLEPHGRGNDPPVLAAREVRICGAPRLVGHDGAHLALHVRQGDAVLRAIGFGQGRRAAELARAGPDAPVAIAFRPFLSRWRGEESVELELFDIAQSPSQGGSEGCASSR